eukprot:13869280-Alexandrium_andersonii.AAC.1
MDHHDHQVAKVRIPGMREEGNPQAPIAEQGSAGFRPLKVEATREALSRIGKGSVHELLGTREGVDIPPHQCRAGRGGRLPP